MTVSRSPLAAFAACLVLPTLTLADLTVRPDGWVAVERLPDEPHRGMTRKKVQRQFGAPRLTVGPVGDPPISRWDYPAFSVYFEGGHVLHTVVHSR